LAATLTGLPAGIYDDTNASWQYTGSWSTWSHSTLYGGSAHYSAAIGDSAQFSFNGGQFILSYTAADSRGDVDVYIDNVWIGLINEYSGVYVAQKTWASPILTPGSHTVRFVHKSGMYVDVDAIQIDAGIVTPTPTVTFTYDADGNMVKSDMNGVITRYVGGHYQVENGVATKYYFAGASRVAMRTGDSLSYFLGDHLGSTSITTDASGNKIAELRYKAWGEVRYTDGDTPTDYQYTGQRSYAGDFGLLFFNARWVDPQLGRFAQPDTIIPSPGNSQSWDRYAYARNNPVRYNDPTGHCEVVCGILLFVGFVLMASQIPSDVPHDCSPAHGCGNEAAFNIGVNVALGAPAIEGLAAYGLQGAGMALNSAKIFGAGSKLLGQSAVASTAAVAAEVATEGSSGSLPPRLARVMQEEDLSGASSLGPPSAQDAFVTTPNDIAGITNSTDLAQRLTMLDKKGNQLTGPFAVLEFDTPASGLASPVFRTHPGFLSGGYTAGGAQEFILPNLPLNSLKNLNIRVIR